MPHRSSPHLFLINAVIESVADQAIERGISVTTLTRRVFQMVEAGELDIETLRAGALRDDEADDFS